MKMLVLEMLKVNSAKVQKIFKKGKNLAVYTHFHQKENKTVFKFIEVSSCMRLNRQHLA